MTPYRPGEHVVLREVWKGHLWTVRPVTVVRDTPGLVALYIAPGTRWRRPYGADGSPLRLPRPPWTLAEALWDSHVLRLTPYGESYSVLPIWDDSWRLRYWYINLEEPLRRSAGGFDYMDWTLDIIVSPDLSRWRWKDEDELQEAVSLGIYSPAEAAEIRAEGERAIERLTARRAPFDEPWQDWLPDPAWPLPQLPDIPDPRARP